jgi:hypothetical protein
VVYDTKITLITITEICNVSVIVYFVSHTKSLHRRTAAVGQVVTERTVSLLFKGKPGYC